ncbi:DMT family transporter [Amycolatopsis sp. EV170708-02-1]|uniref:DMT family transporter n=1 Tax=Amycolatopsis sp. EV170708-02-1 TaxID=2919322 RepID=UPI001F0CC7DE|nr:DMT family transporter [Amycolatopsis sp. EV170708-02-1]UMP06916.1 DMT family transporter [Amycolatopsis sp. EV170708-02-1]
MSTRTDVKLDVKTVAAIAVTMLLWASAFVAIRFAGTHYEPGALALGRLVVGALALGTIATCKGVKLPSRRAWPGIAGAGVFWFGLYMVALNWGERHTDAGTASLVVGIGPVLAAILAGVVLKERLPGRLVTGLVVAFIGAAIVGLASQHGTSTAGGVALCLLAAGGYAVGVVSQKPALNHATALQATTFGCAVGAVACLPFTGQLLHDIASAPASATWSVVYLGLLPTALAFYTWAYALSRTPAGKLGVTTYAVPAIVIVLSWLVLDEVPVAFAVLGGVLCLAGVGISRSKSRRKSK